MLRRFPLIAAVLGVLVDAATTQYCLSSVPRCAEGNPVSIGLFSHLGGLWPTAALLCLGLGAAGWPLWTKRPVARWIVAAVWVALLLTAAQRWHVAFANVEVWAQAY